MAEDMDISSQFKSTSHSILSPTAAHVACLSDAQLQIRCLTTFENIRTTTLPARHDIKRSRIVWSPPTVSSNCEHSSASTPPRCSSNAPHLHSHRVAVFDEDSTRVYDLRDEKWNATISNGSGGSGKNVHVKFGATEDEVLIWCDFNACLKIWCLKTGRSVDIRDPKFTGKDNRGWGYQPRISADGGQAMSRPSALALLCRSSGADVLLLLAPNTYNVLSRTELPTTDAAGLKWSRDGRWLAIWDAPSAGQKACIYTADGHLYRTIAREPAEEASEWAVEGLGIKTLEWVPGNERLAIGGWDRRVRLLSTRTFSPVVFLDHTATINAPKVPVYTENVDGQGCRSYAITPHPVTPLKAPLEKNETGLMKQGISILAFNADGTLCATRDDYTPNTVWIWDLRSLKPNMILVQYAPVRSLQWHPKNPSRLLFQTNQDSPIVYLFTADDLLDPAASSGFAQPPEITSLEMHLDKPTGSVPAKWIATWLTTPSDKKPCLSFGHQQSHILVWPDGKDKILRFEKEDGEESDDSLYDILTGRTPVPRFQNAGGSNEEGGAEMDASMASSSGAAGLDDTFREKRARGNGVAGAQKLMDESGLDEMF